MHQEPRLAQPPGPVMLSERDLRLVHAMQLAPRASWPEIAALVGDGVTPLTVARRWRALYDAGLAWLAVYPDRWWERHQVAWVEVSAPPVEVPGLVSALQDAGSVTSLDVNPGGILAAVVADDQVGIGEWLLGGPLRVLPTEVHLATRLYTRASRWRVGALAGEIRSARLTVPGPGDGPPPPDDRVRRMVAALGPDPRRSVAAIAAEMGERERTVHRWLSQMLRRGDLDIRCEVVPAAVGRRVALHWWLRAPDPDRLAEALVSQSGVRWVAAVVSTTGATTLAAAWLPDLRSVHTLTARVAGQCPEVVTVRQTVDMLPAKRLGWVLSRHGGRRVRYVPLAI